MTRIRELAGAAAVAAVLLLPISSAALAHGKAGEEVAEFYEHMDVYASNINSLIATIEGIVADYEPGASYAEEIEALTKQWETVDFHMAVETKATPLYPPIWAALERFSTALKEGAPIGTVRARAEDMIAALWQGYGALKLLAVRQEHGHPNRGHHYDHDEGEHAPAQTSGDAVIDTINDNLEQVLALYKKSQSEAAQELIYNTYMQYFEGIEGDLIEQNAELVAGLEVAFNATLPRLIKNHAPVEKVAAQIEAMQKDLDKARELLAAAERQESSVF